MMFRRTIPVFFALTLLVGLGRAQSSQAEAAQERLLQIQQARENQMRSRGGPTRPGVIPPERGGRVHAVGRFPADAEVLAVELDLGDDRHFAEFEELAAHLLA